MTPRSDHRLAELLRKRDVLTHEIEREAQRTYPIGCAVSWRHGEHLRGGTVIQHGYWLHTKVETNSGAQVWIEATRFMRPQR